MISFGRTRRAGIEGRKLGAYDYLMKPCHIDRLMLKAQGAKVKKSARENKITQARLHEITLRRGD